MPAAHPLAPASNDAVIVDIAKVAWRTLLHARDHGGGHAQASYVWPNLAALLFAHAALRLLRIAGRPMLVAHRSARAIRRRHEHQLVIRGEVIIQRADHQEESRNVHPTDAETTLVAPPGTCMACGIQPLSG